MKFLKLIVISFPFLGMVFSAYSQSNESMKTLQRRINDTLAEQKGTFAIAFKDLSTGKELLINEQENFHAASTMKTPVMIEVLKQVAQGKFSLDDSFLIKNEFKSIADSS